MDQAVFYGILIPFLGTSLGAACVFFMKHDMSERLSRILTGFAAGVMVAASIWSLLIPAMDQSEEMGKFAFIPAAAGFWGGILFLLLLDHIIPHLHRYSVSAEGPKSRLQRTTMMVLAVTLHNIPEGMTIGASFAVSSDLMWGTGMIMAVLIGLHNIPEGMAVAVPLISGGTGRVRATLLTAACGLPTVLGAWLGFWLGDIGPLGLTMSLGFASGAMLYVVVEELIPEMSQGRHSNLGTVFFAVGFSVMMVLDVALG